MSRPIKAQHLVNSLRKKAGISSCSLERAGVAKKRNEAVTDEATRRRETCWKEEYGIAEEFILAKLTGRVRHVNHVAEQVIPGIGSSPFDQPDKILLNRLIRHSGLIEYFR